MVEKLHTKEIGKGETLQSDGQGALASSIMSPSTVPTCGAFSGGQSSRNMVHGKQVGMEKLHLKEIGKGETLQSRGQGTILPSGSGFSGTDQRPAGSITWFRDKKDETGRETGFGFIVPDAPSKKYKEVFFLQTSIRGFVRSFSIGQGVTYSVIPRNNNKFPEDFTEANKITPTGKIISSPDKCCFNCGLPGHFTKVCTIKPETHKCKKCDTLGHVESVCPGRKSTWRREVI